MYSQELIRTIFDTDPAADDCRNMLEGIIADHPYFSTAAYFLLQKTGKEQPGYDKIAAKTAIFFDNPYLLNFRLSRTVPAAEPKKAEKAIPQENTGEMLFEPLFASDYFASQGIKLSEEVQSGDKLGKQLKSFTDWLKTMKKIHETRLPEVNDQVDIAVQKLAEKSNQEQFILTESMAEAYLQQGKVKKAREIYEKLSLLNPSKNVYFAAKIDRLSVGK